MKVKITYTTEYDDVPDLINELLDSCMKKLAKWEKLKFQPYKAQETVDTINRAVEELSFVSSRLQDCGNMIVGYTQAAANQEENLESNKDAEV
jgi:hypothetical protein